MLAITIRPPWSWAVAEAEALTAIDVDPKLTENRSRKIPDKYIGQQIAIHSGVAWCQRGERDSRINKAWMAFRQAIDLYKPNPRLAAIGDTRTGAVGRLASAAGLWVEWGSVVAVATLTGCHQADQTAPVGTCCWPWGEREYATKKGVVPAWHLTFAGVRRLRQPVTCPGQVFVPWTLPADVADQVQAQVDARNALAASLGGGN